MTDTDNQNPDPVLDGAAQADPAAAASTDAAQTGEPAAAPLETAQDQDQQAGDPAEPAQDGQDKADETQPPAIDAAALAAVTAELKGMIEDGFASIRADFGGKMNELAEHCEGRLDQFGELLEATDVTKLQALVDEAQQAVKAIRESGAADLATRLTTLEMRLRHSL